MRVRIMPGSLLAILAAAPLVAADSPWTAPLIKQALSGGYKKSVPPVLSLVLGLAAKAEAVETRQLVRSDGQKIHTFDVVSASPHQVVLFVVDEAAHSSVTYLLSASGKLRKAVSYDIGAAPHDVPEAQARAGLARERRFWTAQSSAPAPTSAPPPGTPPAGNTPH
jgi:hypothetical protein